MDVDNLPLNYLQVLKLKKIVCVLLYVVMVLVIFTGLGISYYGTMEFLTAGLVTKTLSFYLHTYLFIPLIILFALHTILPVIKLKKY